MHSEEDPAILIRPMASADRAAVAGLVVSVENFNHAERDCAPEVIDICPDDQNQADYRVDVAEDSASQVHAYACWGPVPLTRGMYDLYWIATHSASRGSGFGHALIRHVEQRVLENRGRLLVIENSAKDSCAGTVEFYRRLGYEETERAKDFCDVGDDRLIFVKKLS